MFMKVLDMLIHMIDIFHNRTFCDLHMSKFTGNTILLGNSVNILNQTAMCKVLSG